MNKTVKKIISLFLVLLMCVTALPFAFAADEPCDHEESTDYKNICSKCFGYLGSYDLKVGDNAGFPISYDRYWMVRFVPEKNAKYKFTSISDDTDPYVELYTVSENDNGKLMNFLGSSDDDENGHDFCLEYNFNAGQAYYLSFDDYDFESYYAKEQYTVKIEEVCVHSGTEQDCRGYKCDSCGAYFGEKSDHTKSDDAEQTCAGYLCTVCSEYFGEKDETKHIWNNGWCRFCYKRHNHTGFLVDGLCSVCKYQIPVSVTTNGVTDYYDTTQAAFAACEDGSVVKFLCNYMDREGDSSTISKAITLDMNGYKWSQISSESLYINADATIINSGNGGACVISIIINSSGVILGNGNYGYIRTNANKSVEDHIPECAAIYIDGDDTRLDLSNSNSVPSYKLINIKSNHTFGDVTEAKNATCLATGNDAYKQCTECNKYFASDAVANSMGKDDTTSFTKAKLDHSYTGAYKNNGDGTHSRKCVNGCDNYGTATVHVWDNGTVTTPATHLELGVKTYTCECGATKTEDIAKTTQHTHVLVSTTDATHLKEGLKVYRCACGDEYTEPIAKIAQHTHVLVSTTDATHLKEGLKVYRCACGDEYTETIAKIADHTYANVVTAPTCEDRGYTTHTCACGDSYVDSYVDALGHSYKDGVCTECGDKDPNYNENQGGDTGDNTVDCDCICHNSSKFVQFFYKIARFFWKLFKTHKTCECGAVHY